VKYILLNIVCHSYAILFIAVSIKNIVDMSGNKQFVKTRAFMTLIRVDVYVTAVRQDIASAVWRTYSQLRHPISCHRRSEGRKISAVLAPIFLHTFGRVPGGL